MITEDDPLVLMVEALGQTQTASVAACKAATNAVKAAVDAAETAKDGAGRITALETATTALVSEVKGWRQNSLQAAEARRAGRKWAVAGLAGGLVLYPLLATMLPYGNYLGATAVNGTVNRWNAGEALMHAARPVAWDRLVADWNLIDGTPANARTVGACQKLGSGPVKVLASTR